MKKPANKGAILVALLLVFSTTLLAQKKSKRELTSFKITIQFKDDVVHLTSQEGCAWKELSFPLGKSETQVIDQFGLAYTERESTMNDKDLAHFQFSIHRSIKSVRFSGIEGTSWTNFKVSYSKNEYQMNLSQNGVRIDSSLVVAY